MGVAFDFDSCLSKKDMHSWMTKKYRTDPSKAPSDEILERMGGQKRVTALGDFLQKLKSIETYIISYGYRKNILQVLKSVGLGKYFPRERVFGREELGGLSDQDTKSTHFKVKKLHSLRQDVNMTSEQVLFVDDRADTVNDVFDARAGDGYAPDRQLGLVPELLTKLILGLS